MTDCVESCLNDGVNENSSAVLDISFKDYDEELVEPDSISYRIDCLTNDQEIVGDTVFTPVASEIELDLTPTINAIINQTNSYEKRLVTVTATFNPSDQKVQKYTYFVYNLEKE